MALSMVLWATTAVVMLVVVLAGMGGQAHAWGSVGHQVVAGIAEARLTNTARQAVNTILNGQSLPEVAMWADDVKRKPGYTWSSPLHFVDTEDQACTYSYNDDCFDTKTMQKGVCITAAILNFTQQARLASPLFNQTAITDPLFLHAVPKDEAVKFLVHFLGDVHQPLHTGFRGDLGGNSISVTFFGSSYNLHSVWDSSIIYRILDQDYQGSQDAWQKDLLARVSQGGEWYAQAQNWEKCNTGSLSCTAVYAQESVQAACANAYQCIKSGGKPCPRQAVNSGVDLEEAYFAQAHPVVDLRIAQGGVRLAALLNYLFA